jgi:predicted nuclease of restriction endonuclease-like (RecB) superfamily
LTENDKFSLPVLLLNRKGVNMIKKVIKDGYIIEFPDTTKYTEKEMEEIIDNSLEAVKRKEKTDNKSE